MQRGGFVSRCVCMAKIVCVVVSEAVAGVWMRLRFTFIRQLGSDLSALTHETRHFEDFLAPGDDLLQLGIGYFDRALRLNPMNTLRNSVILPSQLVQLPELSFTIDSENVTRVGGKPCNETTAGRQLICGQTFWLIRLLYEIVRKSTTRNSMRG